MQRRVAIKIRLTLCEILVYYESNMRKLYFIFVFLLSTVFVATVGAESITPTPTINSGTAAEQTQVYTCLKPTWCRDHKDQCVGVTPGAEAHTALLQLPDGVQVPLTDDKGKTIRHYVVEALVKADGTAIPTTGSWEKDVEAGFCGTAMTCTQANANYTMLKNDRVLQYEFIGAKKVAPSNQQTVNTQSIIVDSEQFISPSGQVGPLLWSSQSGGAVNGSSDRFFYVYYEIPEVKSESSTPGGHIQGTWAVMAAQSNCEVKRWDPYGKVFDSQSMEPLPGVEVTLLKRRGDTEAASYTKVEPSEVVGEFYNPLPSTEAGGDFNFVVPVGFYKLEVKKAGYVFATGADGTTPLPLMNDTVYANVYRGEPIEENGQIQHRNVPMDPLPGTTPFVAPTITRLSFLERVNKSNTPIQTVFDIRYSHPYTKVQFYGKNVVTGEKRLLVEKYANAEGFLKAAIDHGGSSPEALAPDEVIDEPVAVKTDLTQGKPQAAVSRFVSWVMGFFVPHVSAQVVTKTYDPVLTYVEGCVDGGNVPSGITKVDVLQTFSNKPYTSVSTDEKGCFKIPSDQLPSVKYVLRYTRPNGQVTTLTTGQFIAANKNYITNNKVDLNKYQDSQGNTTPPKVTGTAQNKAGNGSDEVDSRKNGGVNNVGGFLGSQMENSPVMLVFVVVLLVLGIGGLAFALYLYRKNQETPQM